MSEGASPSPRWDSRFWGARSRLPFWLTLSLKMNLGPRTVVTLVTVVSIASSVALAVGLEMASRSLHTELDRTSAALGGRAQIEVRGGRMGVQDSMLDSIRSTPGVAAASPLIQATFRVAEGVHQRAPIHVIGLDLIEEAAVREYTIRQGGVHVRDPLRLVALPDSLVASASLSNRLGVAEGEAISLFGPSGGRHRLVVRAVLGEGGLADAFAGQVAVMDIWALQALMGRPGRVDRIDVVTSPDSDVEWVLGELEDRLGTAVEVLSVESGRTGVEASLVILDLGAWFLVIVGVLVASLLSYGGISLSVDRRRSDLALLQAAGLEAQRVRGLVYRDAVMMAACGTALGLAVGIPFSFSILAGLSGASEFLQETPISHAGIGLPTVLTGFAIGFVVAVCGSVEPARRASSRPPLDVLIGEVGPKGEVRRGRAVLIFGLGMGLSALLLSFFGSAVPAVIRIALIVACSIGCIAALGPQVVLGALSKSRRLWGPSIPRIGHLVGTALTARPASTGVTIGVVAGIISGVTTVLVVTESIVTTLDAVSAERYQGGIHVAAETLTNVAPRIRAETIELIRSTEGVEAVNEIVQSSVLLRGEHIPLGAFSARVLAERGGMDSCEEDALTLASRLEQGEILMNHAFGRFFEAKVGDEVVLPTSLGPRAFKIAGTCRDFLGDVGTLKVDIATFDAFWTRSGASHLGIWVAGPTEAVLDRIRSRVGERQALFFRHGEQVARLISELMSPFTALLRAVIILTASLSGVAIFNMLLGAVASRRRELARLQAAGATRGNIIALVTSDGLLIGASGATVGVVSGILCAAGVLSVLADSAAWTIGVSLPVMRLLLLVAGVVSAALVASTYPAREASHAVAGEALLTD